MRTWGAEKKGITLQFELEQVFVNLDTAVPCGLIVNELVANALKYAFPAETPGLPLNRPAFVITLKLHRTPEGLIFLSVGDNGVGLPPQIGLTSPGTLGLQVVTLLVE